jgi:transcriptional regulator with XRE-family HTH domain
VPPTIDAELRALAAAVREIRARQQLSQERVAGRGGVGRKYVGQIERGEIVPSFAALVALAKGLSVPLSELVRVYEERLRAVDGAVPDGAGPDASLGAGSSTR